MSKAIQASIKDADGEMLMMEGVTAIGVVKGRLLEMCLEQRFRNATNKNKEITYTFPLPWGAVLMGVEVELNGKKLSGAITGRAQAREKYEEAISEGNTSIMLEHNNDQSYTLELGNLLAGEACVINLRYAQVLQVEQRQLRLILPTAIAPRYGDAVMEGGLQPHQVPGTSMFAEYPFDVSITLQGELAKADIACISHKTSLIQGDDQITVNLVHKGEMDRDFILVLNRLASQSIGIASPDFAKSGQAAVMLNFMPEFEQDTHRPVAAKILVDCSGSMAGDSINSARSALGKIIEGLEKQDRFTLSRFGSTVEHRSRGFWVGGAQAKLSAERWLENLNADLGGTDLEKAMFSTIALANQSQADVLLITDGQIYDIDRVIKTARKLAHRVFIVAIGASPAESHLRRLADATGGVCDFVAPSEEVEPVILRMFNRMRTTRVSDIRVEWPQGWNIVWTQLSPRYAYSGETLSVYAFCADGAKDKPQGVVKLIGKTTDKAKEQVLASVPISWVAPEMNTLARMAGKAKYLELSQASESNVNMKEQAQDVAVTYQLVTDDTNFILVHERAEGEKAQEMPELHQVKHMLAAGWGGTGSVASRHPIAAAVSNSTVKFSKAINSDAQFSLAAPSVWRSGERISHQSRSVNMRDGLDDFEMPAFLRKDSKDFGKKSILVQKLSVNDIDKQKSGLWIDGLTPSGFVTMLATHSMERWPETYGHLKKMGLDIQVLEWLEFVIGIKAEAKDVVRAFIQVMLEQKILLPARKAWYADLLSKSDVELQLFPANELDPILVEAIGQWMPSVTTKQWPENILHFAELEEI